MAAKKTKKSAKKNSTKSAKVSASPRAARSASKVNKSEFVRSLPSTTPGAEVVAKAKAQGIDITLGYVYGIRAKTNAKKRGGGAPKRGPGRPPKAALHSAVNGSASGRGSAGIVSEIERIVEAKVAELLKARLGSIFS